MLSGIKDLFRTYDARISETYQLSIDKFSRGYAKDSASFKKENGSGKEAMPFDLFCILCRGCFFNLEMIKQTHPEFIFARTFWLLQWNLVCRADNMQNIDWSHIAWKNDCLLVYFRRQKNDQDGSRSLDPRSVYANPLKPEICSILSLGIHLLSSPQSNVSGSLFEGNSQSARFGSVFRRFLTKHESILKDFGFDADDFGTHSNRKGASTYVTSGTTDGPSQVAVNLRAGWTMTAVEQSYFRYSSRKIDLRRLETNLLAVLYQAFL
jgi:hypothetical protein